MKRRLLDIGCGDGSLIRHFKSKGWEVAGTEINDSHCMFEELNIKKNLGEFVSGEAFDCVTMWHTLEHMPDINDIFFNIRSLLSPGGKLIIAVPNTAAFSPGFFGQNGCIWMSLDIFTILIKTH